MVLDEWCIIESYGICIIGLGLVFIKLKKELYVKRFGVVY